MFGNFYNGLQDVNKFVYAPGAVHKVPAQVAGEVCAELEAKGNLTPKALVDVARPEDAPMHPEFEWDDAVAAERYREQQASAVIRHLVVKLTRDEEAVEEDGEDREYTVRAYSSTHEPHKGAGVYKYTPRMLSDEEEREILLSNARRDATSFMSKYGTLVEVAGIIDSMKAFVGDE